MFGQIDNNVVLSTNTVCACCYEDPSIEQGLVQDWEANETLKIYTVTKVDANY